MGATSWVENSRAAAAVVLLGVKRGTNEGVHEGIEAASTRVGFNGRILIEGGLFSFVPCFMPCSSDVTESDERDVHVCWTRFARACRNLGLGIAGGDRVRTAV